MEKNDEKKIFKNRMNYLKKHKNLQNKEEKKREIDKILSEYAARHKSVFRDPKTKSLNTLKLNKTYNSKNNDDFSFGKKLSKKKKIEAELFSFSKEHRNFFRKALDKYNFDTEVYIPQNLTKKEYSNKNYLINKLIYIENMNKNIKEIIEPIEKETKQFSKQYKIIKSDNKSKQKIYMNNVEKAYQTQGYKLENIEYKENENIFTPSILLDKKFGKNKPEDVTKYSNENKDFNLDQLILGKLNVVSHKYIEDISDDKKYSTNENWNYNNEKEEEMKKEILKEQRIMNMSKKEYYDYSKKLKKDINLIKKNINELIKNKINSQNESEINTNRTNYTGSFNNKSNLDLNQQIKDNKDKKFSEAKKNLKKKKYDDEKNIFVSAKGLDLETDFNTILPSINSLIENKKEKEIKNKTIQAYNKKKVRNNNRFQNEKQKKINKLYSFLNNNTGNYEYPKKEIENYFKKYSQRQLPPINSYTGSNIHGIFVDFQNQVKENNFVNLAKGNEFIKIDLDNNYISTNNNSFENKIIKIDEKINNLDFAVLDKLLVNNKKEFLNN